MSLRWKLVRFLSAEKVIDPPPEETPSPSGLFVGLKLGSGLQGSSTHRASPSPPSSSPTLEDGSYQRHLRELASATSRATAAHSAQNVYALALARGVMEVFLFGGEGICPPEKLITEAESTLPSLQLRSEPSSAHYEVRAHDPNISALTVVSRSPEEMPLIVTVGNDSKYACVKLWGFSHVTGAVGAPQGRYPADVTREPPSAPYLLVLSAVLKTQTDVVPSSVAVLDGSDPDAPLRAIAVGFEDGSVTIFRGDLLREQSTTIHVSPAPGEMREAQPVLSLAFCDDALMCVTSQSVAAIRTESGKGSSSGTTDGRRTYESDFVSSRSYIREVLDSRGASHASAVTHVIDSGEIVVAREEALYFFSKDARGSCLAFPSQGPATIVAAFGPYVVHATEPHSLVVYDVQSKILAYRGNTSILSVYADNEKRTACIVLADCSILRFEEAPLESRVRMLISRHLHSSAIQLAKIESSPLPSAPSQLFTDAVQQYASFLMQKNDYDEAAEQLIGTIGGSIEPSWVITRLVEQPGLRSGLRSYLEALHRAGQASFVHTRVLITCYRHDRARAAILSADHKSDPSDEHIIQFMTDVDWTEPQVDTAIDICRDAGLFGVAEMVARKRQRNILLARTLVDDLDDVQSALAHLRELSDRSEALQIAELCGRKLLARSPKEFVTIATRLISDQPSSSYPSGSQPVSSVAALERLAKLFVDRPQWLAALLEGVLNRASASIPQQQAPALWLMLFEALTRADVDRNSRAPVGRSALRVLQSRTAKIDLHDALQIAEQYGHGPCLEHIYEHLRMYRELAQHLRWSGDVEALLRSCRRHGTREPRLWLEALRLLAPRAGAEQAAREYSSTSDSDGTPGKISRGRMRSALTECMYALDKSGLLSPVEIMDTVCAACPEGGWSIVETYFERTIERLSLKAKEEESAAMNLAQESTDMKAETQKLCGAVIIKPRACGVCEDDLTLPSVHFFCGHSYRAACITPSGVSPMLHIGGDAGSADGLYAGSQVSGSVSEMAGDLDSNIWTDVECPRCAPELDAMESMRNALEERNERHDDFFRQLRGSKGSGGYNIVMGYLARSAFL